MTSHDAKPNILLITTDQQRFDTLGIHGSRVARTPMIDRFAGNAAVFENAFCQNPVCIPSRACIQTGRYTHQHGVRYMESAIDASPGLPVWERTFMEELQENGYRTGATGKIHMMPERGFDWLEVVGGKGQRWTQSEGQAIGPAPLGVQYRAWVEARCPGAYERIYQQRRQPEYRANMGAIANVLPLELYVETYILEKSMEFIREAHDSARPFFLWCGFCGPHGPHDPPASHAGMYSPDEIPLPSTLDADIGDKPAHLRRLSRPPMAEREGGLTLRRWMAHYFALVTLIDGMVGQLTRCLRDRGILDETLVIYTTDHGEMLGDFGMTGKGSFFESVIHLPLLIRPPGGMPGQRRINSLVETMDIAATVLDYAGVRAPEQMQATSLRPLIEGDRTPERDSILCEYTSNDQTINGKCLRNQRWKYCVWDVADGGELYDLRSDPMETRNLWHDPASAAAKDELQCALLAKLMRSERPYVGARAEPY